METLKSIVLINQSDAIIWYEYKKNPGTKPGF